MHPHPRWGHLRTEVGRSQLLEWARMVIGDFCRTVPKRYRFWVWSLKQNKALEVELNSNDDIHLAATKWKSVSSNTHMIFLKSSFRFALKCYGYTLCAVLTITHQNQWIFHNFFTLWNIFFMKLEKTIEVHSKNRKADRPPNRPTSKENTKYTKINRHMYERGDIPWNQTNDPPRPE